MIQFRIPNSKHEPLVNNHKNTHSVNDSNVLFDKISGSKSEKNKYDHRN